MADTLTEREREVLRLLGLGRSTPEIARALGMSEDTVLFYVGYVVERIGAARADEAARRLALRARVERSVAASVTPLVAVGITLFALGVIVAGARHIDPRAPAPSPATTASPSAAATTSPDLPAGGQRRDGSSSETTAAPAPPRPAFTIAPLPTVPPLSAPMRPLPTLPPVLPPPTLPLPTLPLPTLPLPTPSLP